MKTSCSAASQAPVLESGENQGGGNRTFGSPGTTKPGEAFFTFPEYVCCFSSPHRPKWIAPPISSPAPRAQWNIPLPLRSWVCVAGNARAVARESPGRDGFARPQAALPSPSHPSFPCALFPHPSPSPVGSSLGRSKQRVERGLRTQARWEFARFKGPAARVLQNSALFMAGEMHSSLNLGNKSPER